MNNVVHAPQRAKGLDILLYPDPLLLKTSERVEKVDESVATLAQTMMETLKGQRGAGLAAVQVGKLRRMIVIDPACDPERAHESMFTMINPVIVESSGAVIDEEGCLSMPKIFTQMARPKYVTARYLDIDGAEQAIEAEGFLARCIAHEVDHLDGILFWDYLNGVKKEILKIKHWRNQL